MKRIVPGGVGFGHGIEHGQELAHAGNQRDLGQFAGCFETLIEGLDSRVVAGCSERRHVQHAANFKAPALYTSSSLTRARIASDRGNAHECRNLATIELAQFRQLSNQAGTGSVSYTHLDVYKRQSSSLTRARIASDRGNAHECRNLATIELAQFRQLSNQAGTGSVSYTHLDVYKRQSSSLTRARIASDRGNAHECRNLATIELAQFRQLSNQAGTGYRADAASRLQQSVEFTKVFANVADHLTIDVVELGLNGGDDGLQTGGQTLGRALQPLSPGLNIQPGLSSWTKRRHVAMYEGSKLSDRRPRSGSGPPDDR